MRFRCGSVFLLLILSTVYAFGSDSVFFQAQQKKSELRAAMLSGDARSDNLAVNSVGTCKSPKKGLVFSAVLPGSGQFYGGSWIKGAAFLGVELGCWIGAASLRSEGEDLEKEFQAYADTHWDRIRWENSKQPNDPETHHLPPVKTQQYYEMIGKYDQFKRGWDDWDPGDGDVSDNRETYETMRDDSNQKYILASRLTMVILANHVLSGLEAAWSINRKNIKLNAGAQIIPQGEGEYATVGMIQLHW